MSISYEQLCEEAIKAQANAYAPYSNFKVGAALLCNDGQIYTGCNIENASFGATICAERCAITNALSDGKREFTMIAITSSDGNFTMPCGICRQVISEFMPEGDVIVTNGSEYKVYSAKELLPMSFTFNIKDN